MKGGRREMTGEKEGKNERWRREGGSKKGGGMRVGCRGEKGKVLEGGKNLCEGGE